jgi:CheY-like chemotaxis protein
MVSSLKKQILCVDDVEDNCELFSVILGQAGYDVASAQSFTDALRLIENNPFDLYLFDISIAGGSGFELLTKARQIDPSKPVIICTADIRASTKQQATAAGAQALLTKPIDFETLLATTAQLLHSIETTVD